MAAPGGKGQAGSPTDTLPAKEGFLSKVKDSLNLTKHFGFVSDLDSPASQAALAAVREKEEREGVAEVVEQPPISERIKGGVASVAATVTEITAGTAGGVAPTNEASPEEEEAESVKGGALPDAGVPRELEHQEDSATRPVAQEKEQGKESKSWAHWPGHKETDANVEKEKHGFSQWALHTAHKLGNAVASKDLTDDPSSKKSSKK